MERYTGPSINAWPSFADLMLSVVLVLVTILVAAVVFITTGPDYRTVEASQLAIREAMAEATEAKFEEGEGRGVYDMTICTKKPMDVEADSSESCEEDELETLIQVTDEPLIQKITFRGQLLFASAQANLTDHGEYLVEQIGTSIVSQLSNVREVQILGHADTSYDKTKFLTDDMGTSEEKGRRFNLGLASDRALAVFDLLEEVGVDPVAKLMSAASYGSYRPVTRRDGPYSEAQLRAANVSEPQRARNRRIELWLHFTPPSDAVEQ